MVIEDMDIVMSQRPWPRYSTIDSCRRCDVTRGHAHFDARGVGMHGSTTVTTPIGDLSRIKHGVSRTLQDSFRPATRRQGDRPAGAARQRCHDPQGAPPSPAAAFRPLW